MPCSRFVELLNNSQTRVQDQVLMVFRNLFHGTNEDIQQVLSDAGEAFLSKLEEKLNCPNTSTVMHTLYVMSSVASGKPAHKKIMGESRFLNRAVALLGFSYPQVKIAAINFLLNMLFKDKESDSDSRHKKAIEELGVLETAQQMKTIEKDRDVLTFVERLIK